MCDITKVGTLWNAENEFFLRRYRTRCGLSRQGNDFWTLVQITHVMTTSQRHKSSDDTVPMAQEPSSGSGVKRSNLEAIRRAGVEAEKALKRANVLEERRAAKRASTTPMDELKESATNAEVSAESLMIAAEAVLTETRDTIEALTVSALPQAHEMSHRPETRAESFFQAHKDMTVPSKEQARQKQLDFLESMKVFEEVYEDELPAGTDVMSGRWVDTMKLQRCGDPSTLREVTKNLTAMKVALRLQQQYRASVCSWQRVSTNEIRDTKLLWQTTHKLFSTLKSAKANSCMHNHLKAGTRRF